MEGRRGWGKGEREGRGGERDEASDGGRTRKEENGCECLSLGQMQVNWKVWGEVKLFRLTVAHCSRAQMRTAACPWQRWTGTHCCRGCR